MRPEVLDYLNVTPCKYGDLVCSDHFRPDCLSVYCAARFLKIHLTVQLGTHSWSSKKHQLGKKDKGNWFNMHLAYIGRGFFVDLRSWYCAQELQKNKPAKKGDSFYRGVLAPSIDVIVEIQCRCLDWDSAGTSTEVGTCTSLDLSTTSTTNTDSTNVWEGETFEFIELMSFMESTDQKLEEDKGGLDVLAEAASRRKSVKLRPIEGFEDFVEIEP